MESSCRAETTRAFEAQLEAGQVMDAVVHYDEREIEGLPPPGQRHFRNVLKDGRPVIAT